VGITAVQFARASGYRNILTTSSPSRFDLLKRLGAAHVFDYSSPTVTADIRAKVEEIGQGPITHALDSIGSADRPMSSQLVLDCVDDSATLACTTIAVSKRFKMPVAMTHLPFQIKPPGAPGVISIPARPADHWNVWKAFEWAIQNYGSAFELPAVEVIEATAEQALEEANKVANGARGFGKLVFKMPFKWSALVEL
jgi:NADPH:quinone reductase-like Zn-dependent oxidoreductase